MSTTGIEWTDQTWNPVVGCTPVSPGCLNCYAATVARRLEAMGKKEYQPRIVAGSAESENVPFEIPGDKTYRIAEKKAGRAVFTGEVRTLPDRLMEPLTWKKPRRVFVNSMSDLFHEDVPFEFIDRVLAVIAMCKQHTFQVLTKRPERMAEYFAARPNPGMLPEAVAHAMVDIDVKAAYANGDMEWPLSNLWLGTSVEDQPRADERIPWLLKCPAAVRFLSCEPLIGPLRLSKLFAEWKSGLHGDPRDGGEGIHWVIVGGESGAKSRPCDVAWIRSIVSQCKSAGVPVFVKQLGRNIVIKNDSMSEWPREGDGLLYFHEDERMPQYQGAPMAVRTEDRKGGDPSEWPEDLRVREFPAVAGQGVPLRDAIPGICGLKK